MSHKELIAQGLKWRAVSLKYPFDPDLPVLFVGSKMFALFGRTGDHESVNLKAEPEEAWLLRQQYPSSVLPGYHMNKKHWNTVVLDGSVPGSEVLAMMEQSYQLAWGKLTKRERDELK
ncbi:MmcQ/YjbR family DNA-binding protein [Cohnella luojiensis]|uniref:MmcQ/YjbR family DNA-binding protein n=1 Tax=Cohnella luojiensis TaxID=652876 RepID=A0A4Y8M3K6_9BACL|nr:MmcQ/YjbR family DNA-binding protein [Cohnella luojiensis]TFE29018.1 MmcQ/YjbR family DNA-binding protein [Cohnella luojiensis]